LPHPQLEKIKGEIADASNSPQDFLLEALHSSGYSGALAKPLMAPASALQRLDSSILGEFVAVRLIINFSFTLSLSHLHYHCNLVRKALL
jgi:hypothetical protein